MKKVGAHLELKIENSGTRVNVGDLGLALVSVSDMYSDFAVKMGATDAESAFEVKDLRKGSAVIDIIASGIGLMDQAVILKNFHDIVKNQVTEWISGVPEFSKKTEAESQASKIEGMARAVADSEDGKLSLAYKRETEEETEILMVTKEDGQKMLENFATARQTAQELIEPSIDHDKPQRVLMRLYQHNQDPDASQKKRTYHKAIVRNIDGKPRPLSYLNQEVAGELSDIVSTVPYVSTLFDVDIELVREGGALKSFRLANVHGYFDDPDLPLLES